VLGIKGMLGGIDSGEKTGIAGVAGLKFPIVHNDSLHRVLHVV